jgi:hypothetical protein
MALSCESITRTLYLASSLTLLCNCAAASPKGTDAPEEEPARVEVGAGQLTIHLARARIEVLRPQSDGAEIVLTVIDSGEQSLRVAWIASAIQAEHASIRPAMNCPLQPEGPLDNVLVCTRGTAMVAESAREVRVIVRDVELQRIALKDRPRLLQIEIRADTALWRHSARVNYH